MFKRHFIHNIIRGIFNFIISPEYVSYNNNLDVTIFSDGGFLIRTQTSNCNTAE